MMKPLVLDISHHNNITDMKAIYDAGIRGIIHKATEGNYNKDAKYKTRRQWALDNGLLWGAYHFAHNSNIADQVKRFLDYADPDDNTLLALDFEENKHGTMSLSQAKQFLQLVRDKTGQKPKIYGGSLIKSTLGNKPDAFLSGHRLWMPQYGPTAVVPKAWKSYWLWQYTGDGRGQGPHEIAGVSTKGIDLNVFGGEDLQDEWVDKLSIV